MMNEQENAQQIQPEAEDVEVEVVEQEAVAETNPDDELENYTKSVSKRINKLNERNRQVEEKAARLEQMLAQKQQETALLNQEKLQTQQNLLLKEKVRAQEEAQQQNFQNPQPVQQEQYQNYQQPQQVAPDPSPQAKGWHEKNQWYGDNSSDETVQATQFAYFTHYNLINEGYEADSDDYYSELNSRVYKVYPDLQANEDVQNEDRPAVQRVTSTSVGSRQKTQGKKNGVTFSKSEVERLRGLKPHNMSEEAWLKSVAKEKQKISQREAK